MAAAREHRGVREHPTGRPWRRRGRHQFAEAARGATPIGAHTVTGMKWIIGIDLGERSEGAIEMAAWLHAHHRDPQSAAPTLVGAYVLDGAARSRAEHAGGGAIVARAEAALQQAVARAEATAMIGELRVLEAPAIDDALARAATEPQVDGLVLGRIAARDSHALVRLGSIARRMLRRLPAPVMIVPPDLPRDRVGKGPILVATDLGASAVRATQLGERLAKDLGRELVVAHVDCTMRAWPTFYGEGIAQVATTPTRTRADVGDWQSLHGLGGEPRVLSGMTPLDGLMAEADRIDAPVVVCGAEHVGPLDRLFGSSTASDLARLSRRAVLAVPAV